MVYCPTQTHYRSRVRLPVSVMPVSRSAIVVCYKRWRSDNRGAAPRLSPSPGNLPFPTVGQVGTVRGRGIGLVGSAGRVSALPEVRWSGTPEATAPEARGPIMGTPIHRHTGRLVFSPGRRVIVLSAAEGGVIWNARSHHTRSPWADHGNAHPSAHRSARVSRS